MSVQREHEMDEIEAEDELEAVRGQGEGKCTEIHPDDIVHQSGEEDYRLKRGLYLPQHQVVSLPKLYEVCNDCNEAVGPNEDLK